MVSAQVGERAGLGVISEAEEANLWPLSSANMAGISTTAIGKLDAPGTGGYDLSPGDLRSLALRRSNIAASLDASQNWSLAVTAYQELCELLPYFAQTASTEKRRKLAWIMSVYKNRAEELGRIGNEEIILPPSLAYLDEGNRSLEAILATFGAKNGTRSSGLTTSSHATRSTYLTAGSRLTAESYHTAIDDSPLQEETESEWRRYLRSEELFLPHSEEINWSGRGQHVEYEAASDVPLHVERILGSSEKAVVESVMCRRVRLARKRIACSGRMDRELFLLEAKHLNRLRHPHIIQLVGTYVLRRSLSILLYPAADYALDTFMENCSFALTDTRDSMMGSLENFPRCLESAVNYIHNSNTKHMDIKPKNVLVRYHMSKEIRYRVYLADFGIARSYPDPSAMDTSSPTSFTRPYCAPEVANQDRRGIAADIFSLGCVFAEIYTVLAGKRLYDFIEARTGDRNSHFCDNTPSVFAWMSTLTWPNLRASRYIAYERIVPELIARMLAVDPKMRASHGDIKLQLMKMQAGPSPCCLELPEEYECAEKHLS